MIKSEIIEKKDRNILLLRREAYLLCMFRVV